MDGRIAGILVVALMCLPAIFPAALASTGESRVKVTSDGLYWSDDKRLTDNPATDYFPQLWVDKDGITRIVWVRDGEFYIIKLDEEGRIIGSEHDLTTAWIPAQHTGQYVRSLGMDSQGNLAMIRLNGGSPYSGIIYDKFDANGKQLTESIDVTSGLQLSMGPNMGVGVNDQVFVAYDYFPPGGLERVAATMIDSKGNIIKTAVEISNSSVYVDGSTFIMDREGRMRVLINVWYGALQGMWATTIDKFGVQPADMTPHHLYNTGSYSFPPMPAMAACPDGSLGLLRSSSGSGGGVLTYLKLDEKNVPVAGIGQDIVITDNAADYGDLACDSNNVVYAVWSNATDGLLYYTAIHPGTEGQAHKAVQLTTQGTGRDPRLAVDRAGGLHVAWRDDRDGNPEIYHKYMYGAGVELSMTPEEVAKMMFIHPGEIKSGNVTIKNLGGLNDTFQLNLTVKYSVYNASSGEVWLDDYIIDLESLVTNKLLVHVKGPECGNMNDYIEVTINATSVRNPWKNASVSFKVFTMCCEEIRISFADNVHMTGAGQMTEFYGILRNQGDLEEDIVLTLDGPADWNFTLAVNEVTLKPRSSATIFLRVTPPADAMGDEIGQVQVEAYSVERPQVKDNAITHTIVTPMMAIGLSIPDPIHYIDPGNTTEFDVEVSNNGNLAGLAIIVLEIISGVGDFIAFWDRSSVGLAARSKDTVTLTVVSPEDAKAGTRLVIRTIAFNEYKTQSAEATVTVVINQVHILDVSVSPASSTVDPGGSVPYQVQVTNQGNGDELLTPGTALLPPGWALTYGSGGGGVNAVLLTPGASATLSMEVRAPLEALEGVYDVAGILLNEEGGNWTFPVKTIVRQVYSVELTVAQSKRHGTPGGWALFDCRVKNLGNGLDMVSLNVSGLPASWRSQFTLVNEARDKVALEARASEHVSLVVTIPADAASSNVDFSVSAISSVGIRDTAALAITVGLPNLVLANATFTPQTYKVNKAVTIEVLVRNVGEGDCYNVTVVFYDELRQVDSKTIVVFPAGTSKSVVFEWVPSHAGDHRLRFVVDPEGKIAESDKTDNTLMDKVTVKGGGGSTPGFEGELVLLTIIFVTIIVLLKRRR